MNEELYQQRVSTAADCNEHLPTLRKLAAECRKVMEIGTWTGCSATGLLMGLIDSPEEGKSLTVLDINEDYLKGTADWLSKFQVPADVHVNYLLGDSLRADIDTVDLLFIDSWHCYDQLHSELTKHAKDVRKYIAMHDTVTFGFNGEDGKSPGLLDAIDDFLAESDGEWVTEAVYENNNGLTVLKRVEGGPKAYFLKSSAGLTGAKGLKFESTT